MKNFIKYILQKILGFENYLFIFSLFKIHTLKWDKKEKDFFIFLNMLKDDCIVFDIGANVGIMTVHLAHKLKNGIVHAFEPMPENFSVLKKIVAHYNLKNVTLFDFALGNENGEIEMVMPVVNSVRMQGLSHVDLSEQIYGVRQPIAIGFADTPNPSPKNRRGETSAQGIKHKVEVKKPDDAAPFNQPVGGGFAMKIDVENFEYFVFKGAENFIKKHHPLIYIELWENENRQQCFEFLTRAGYSAFAVENGKPVKFQKEKHFTQNFIFIKN